MLKEITVNIGNLLLSFSDAIDLARQAISDHQIRTTYIAWQIDRHSKIHNKGTKKIFTAALLHDVGALSVEDKLSLHNLAVHAVLYLINKVLVQQLDSGSVSFNRESILKRKICPCQTVTGG